LTSLTNALPLICGIDNQISFAIVDYFTNINVWTKQVFQSSQYAYGIDDFTSKNRPTLICIPKRSHKNSFGYSQTGIIELQLHFSFQQQRINLAQNVIQIANLIQLINLNQKLTQYAQTVMYGLFWIGKECNADYTKVYAKEAIVTLELDYKVDLLAYQRGLQSNGFDITSPDEQIYQIAQTFLMENALI